MSWKGFKKAVTRLPQQVMQKAGYADETFDEEFERIEAEYKELEQSAKNLAEESRAYITSVRSMMTAQKQFAVAMQQMFTVNTEEPRSQYEAAIESYITTSTAWADSMAPFLDQTLTSIVLDPASALVVMTKQVRGMIEKRSRKLVDYDRTRNALKKAKEKIETSTSADVTKVTKAEVEFDESRRDYESLNLKLKQEIPILLQYRSHFMDPLLEALISFQVYFFEQGASSMQSLSAYIDLSRPIQETFAEKREPALEFLKTLSLVVPSKIDANADPSSRAEYHGDSKEMPPSYSDAEAPFGSANFAGDASSSSGGGLKFAIALYPFRSDTPGDLPFEKDDKIQVLQMSNNQEDWWVGSISGRQGYFPANYVRLL